MENKQSEENETLSLSLLEKIPIFDINNESILLENYGVTSEQLENLVSSYTDTNNRNSLYENIELLGGTKGILQKLNTSYEEGIQSLYLRKEKFGTNKIFEEPPASFWKFLKESLSELMIIIILIAAFIQIVIGLTISDQKKTGWLDGASVLFAVFIVVLVESITNWQKEKKFFELNTLKNATISFKTIRNNIKINIKSEDLLVGDIIFISLGEVIPADLFVIESNGIKIDESSLTGESKAVSKETYENCILAPDKKNISPIILAGTDCIEGNGKAIVIGVGEKSTKGKIQRLIDNSKDEKSTPLEEKLDALAKKIGIFAISAGITTFVCLTIRLVITFISDYKLYRKQLNNNQNTPILNLTHPKSYLFPRILENFMITSVIITISLPEGLPMAVALTLALSLKKLMDKNNLVRKMHSCETMGGANYILTDKTGTLTTNELTVVKILTPNEEIDLNENKNMNQNNFQDEEIRENSDNYFNNGKYWELLRTALSLNVESHISYLNEPNINGDIEVCESKNKTDHALIKFLYRLRSPISEIENKYPKDNRRQTPFDSNKKRMTTFVKENEEFFRLYTKGGAENIKKYCKYYINSKTGEKMELNSNIIKHLEEKIEIFNNDMLRTIYVCYKDIKEEQFYDSNEEIDTNDLILLAIFGIRDQIRKGVKEAILKCREASINVIMVTGDNIQTAHAIAKECNLINKNCSIQNDLKNKEEILNNEPPIEINGDIFFKIIGGIYCDICNNISNICKCPKTNAEAEILSKKLNQPLQPLRSDKIKNIENFKKIVENLRIMARSKPIHKYALVLGLKELNNIVAVTGDGTNDAPALSKSDVGFSMFDGTDIAKNSSDIILMDNNFSSIVTAIKYGRNVIDNLRKFIQFQLVINLTVCSFIIICSCIGSETPIKSIQMLWIDLIMDALATLTLASEPPFDGLLKRKPTKRNENIINCAMIKHVFFQTSFLFLNLMIIYLYGPKYIQEQDLSRIAENKIILECFGTLPGGYEPNKIIYGIKTYWPNYVEINKNLLGKGICGDYVNYDNLSKAYELYNKRQGAPVQLTMIFNIFVLYTLFNQLNCRIVDETLNIFARILNNRLFILVEIFEFLMQIIIIEYWNIIFKTTKNGLTIYQWGICLFISSISLLLDCILKIQQKSF